jgi:hypothetical protein
MAIRRSYVAASRIASEPPVSFVGVDNRSAASSLSSLRARDSGERNGDISVTTLATRVGPGEGTKPASFSVHRDAATPALVASSDLMVGAWPSRSDQPRDLTDDRVCGVADAPVSSPRDIAVASWGP